MYAMAVLTKSAVFCAVFASLLVLGSTLPLAPSSVIIEDRLAVIRNKGSSPDDFNFAFDSYGGKLRFKQSGKDGWTSWHDLGSPNSAAVISNPFAIHGLNNLTYVFALAGDGQVYVRRQESLSTITFTDWEATGPMLPMDKGAVLHGKDNVAAVNHQGKVTLFCRSLTNSSHLYWTQLIDNKWSNWTMIGGSSVSLLTDVAVAYNPFSKYLEAFAVMTDKKMYRIWQTGSTKWVSWDKTGYGAPTSVHAPVVHAMSGNFFNGRLNVFVHGEDGYLHHIWQTTCDKVPNPWGWCTWSWWYKIGNPIPEATPSANSLSIGANIHQGIEVFTVSKEGGLWHLWELERGADWSSWQYVGQPQSGPMATHASIVNDEKDWWAAYAIGGKDEVELIVQNRSMSLSASKVSYGKPVTVSWSVPQDEATEMDWIGVYPSGKDNSFYVDFYYIGGGQNPTKGARPKGTLTFRSFLPKGEYEYRYLVNKRFFDAMRVLLTVTKGSQDKEWVQVYHGIAIGLGKENVSFDKCVEDGNQTVETFKAAFEAFDNRQVWRGMQLVGQALMDVYKAFEACEETEIAKELEKLATDFIKCTESDCVNFAIDTVEELLILFENIYEIYGDIKGASNAFKVNAYEQGGFCIGRVIAVCMSLPVPH